MSEEEEKELKICPYLSYFVRDIGGGDQNIDNPPTGLIYGNPEIGKGDEIEDPPKPIPELGESISHLIGGVSGKYMYMDCIEERCSQWDGDKEICGVPQPKGKADGIPSVVPLVSEFHGHEDLDKNDMIYGTDFLLSDPPPMLLGIPDAPLPKMTLKEYIDDTKVYEPLFVENRDQVDKDENGLIYGVDFILSDPPTLLQYIINEDPLITTMSLQEYTDSITPV